MAPWAGTRTEAMRGEEKPTGDTDTCDGNAECAHQHGIHEPLRLADGVVALVETEPMHLRARPCEAAGHRGAARARTWPVSSVNLWKSADFFLYLHSGVTLALMTTCGGPWLLGDASACRARARAQQRMRMRHPPLTALSGSVQPTTRYEPSALSRSSCSCVRAHPRARACPHTTLTLHVPTRAREAGPCLRPSLAGDDPIGALEPVHDRVDGLHGQLRARRVVRGRHRAGLAWPAGGSTRPHHPRDRVQAPRRDRTPIRRGSAFR